MINITICGRLTRDATIRFTADGSPVLGFSVACDVGFGQNKHPVYVSCSLWGKRAESLDPYLKKGVPVTVIGAGDLRTWEKGEKHGAEITVNVTEVVMQGKRPDTSPGNQEQPEGFRKPAPAMAAPSQDDAFEDFEDSDIPF